jgi:hypothetical protein
MVGWRLKSSLQGWIGWVDICRYVVRGCVGRHRERFEPIRFALRSAVVSDGQIPSSVSPPTRDARGRMFDPAAVGACSVRLGGLAAVRRVRRQAVSMPVPGRSGERYGMQAALLHRPSRHAARPFVPADRIRVHESATAGIYRRRENGLAGYRSAYRTPASSRRGRGMGGAFAAQAFGERRARRVRRGLARFGLGRTGGDALREASSSTATRKRMIARCVRCRIATCPDQQRFPAPKTRKSG